MIKGSCKLSTSLPPAGLGVGRTYYHSQPFSPAKTLKAKHRLIPLSQLKALFACACTWYLACMPASVFVLEHKDVLLTKSEITVTSSLKFSASDTKLAFLDMYSSFS